LIEIDGSMGEGGGQILRSSLSLALCTGVPVRVHSVRAGRKKPGLLRQHLTAVRAAQAVSGAEVEGASLGSGELHFAPGAVRGGRYRFDIGSAGSSILVLQTVLVPLLRADGESELTITGGTDNPMAPPAAFVERSFLPLMARMGAGIEWECVRRGFYPAGGGEIRVRITPGPLAPLSLLEPGARVAVRGAAEVSRLSIDIAKREARVLKKRLAALEPEVGFAEIAGSPGPGNIVTVTVQHEHVTEVMSTIGERRLRAEAVAARAAGEALAYIESGAAVGQHLADQLLLPMALAGGGAFTTVEPSLHTRTQAEVLQRFLPVQIEAVEEGPRWRVGVRASS